LVSEAAAYPWSSAAKFELSVTPAWAKTIYGFQYTMIATADCDDEVLG
jgi:hypothetical protein